MKILISEIVFNFRNIFDSLQKNKVNSRILRKNEHISYMYMNGSSSFSPSSSSCLPFLAVGTDLGQW